MSRTSVSKYSPTMLIFKDCRVLKIADRDMTPIETRQSKRASIRQAAKEANYSPKHGKRVRRRT